MPKHVDHDLRRREILDATCRVLGEGGLKALSFRNVAQSLGGSTTLVTHYFASQDALLDGLAGWLVDDWEKEIGGFESTVEDPHERLVLLLEWLVPFDENSLTSERARIALLAERLGGQETRDIFDSWERRMRKLIRDHLTGLVPAGELEMRVDMVRVLTNGLTLSTIEHPEIWTKERLRSVLLQGIADMGIDARKKRRQASKGA